jgi:hypothetical protein
MLGKSSSNPTHGLRATFIAQTSRVLSYVTGCFDDFQSAATAEAPERCSRCGGRLRLRLLLNSPTNDEEPLRLYRHETCSHYEWLTEIAPWTWRSSFSISNLAEPANTPENSPLRSTSFAG